MNWKNKTLLALTVAFASGCASNALESANSSVNNDAFYASGTKTLDRSQVATIVNQSISTNITAVGKLKTRQSLFSKRHRVFIVAPGKVVFTIGFNNGDGAIRGRPQIAGNVKAGKTYTLTDNIVGNRVLFTLTDVNTKQETKMFWPNGISHFSEGKDK